MRSKTKIFVKAKSHRAGGDQYVKDDQGWEEAVAEGDPCFESQNGYGLDFVQNCQEKCFLWLREALRG